MYITKLLCLTHVPIGKGMPFFITVWLASFHHTSRIRVQCIISLRGNIQLSLENLPFLFKYPKKIFVSNLVNLVLPLHTEEKMQKMLK